MQNVLSPVNSLGILMSKLSEFSFSSNSQKKIILLSDLSKSKCAHNIYIFDEGIIHKV
jgi:hypothetical protein